ncbi:MAG: efflux RND transporter permease subunit [Bacteroidota bacterium]
MTFTEIAIRRPVFLWMVIGAFIVFGLISLTRMGASLAPEVDYPVITVATVYPGANPEEIETSITKLVEETVSTINGVDHVESWTLEGISTVLVRFKLGINGDNARLDVQKKVDELRFKLPEDSEVPLVSKVDFTSIPIMNIAVSSKQRQLDELYYIIDKQVKDKLQRLEGVAEVLLTGQKERQININVDPERLAQYKLSITDVIDVLKMDNLDVPSGLIETKAKELGVRIAGRFRSVDAMKEAPIFTPIGEELRLKNVATVADTFKRMNNFSRLNGTASLGITIRNQPGTNSVRVADLVKEELERIKNQLPSDITFAVAYDQSTFTKESIGEVSRNLLEAIALTAFIIFLFLRKVRNTIIVLLAIPTSLIATFSLMYYAGFTFNILSLMALGTAIGILVDDAIVVLENTDRHLGLGKNPFRAALDGRNEIGLAAISITMTDVAVFLPIAFMGGVVGRFFAQYGLTLSFAVLFSLFISFTLTPMLASRWLKKESEKIRGEKKNRMLESLKYHYRRFNHWALGHRKTVVAVTTIIFLVSLLPLLFGFVSTEFFTNPDRGELMVEIETPVGTSLEMTDRVAKMVEEKIAALPEVKSYFITLGNISRIERAFSGNQLGQMKVILLPKGSPLNKGKNYRSTEDVAKEIRRWNEEIAGVKLRVAAPSIFGGADELPIQIEISGTDTKDFNAASEAVIEAVKKIPGAIEVESTWKGGVPEIKAEIDRIKCAVLGVPTALVGRTLRASIDGDVSNKYKEGDREYDVRITLQESKKKSITDISKIQIKSLSGEMIELGQVAKVYQDFGPSEIRRKDHSRQFVVNANIAGRPLGDVSGDIKRALRELKFPDTITGFSLVGDVEMMEETFSNLTIALVLSILFVYMVMASLFESLLYPFIILFSLPITLVGVVSSLLITGKTLNLFSMIGIVMLVGLVVHNAILLIDYTNTLRKRGLNRSDALLEAGTARLRPILMTTLALIFGMLPLALELGPGSEMRSGMAVVIMGGMTSSTLLTLVFIPVVYSIVDDVKVWLGRLLKLRSVKINIDESLQ